MKKVSAKIFSVFIILLGLLAGFFVLTPKLETKAAGVISANTSAITIRTAAELGQIISTYGAGSIYDGSTNFLLAANIDMKDYKNQDGTQKALTSTLGTVDEPFAGIFDGQGYKISNLLFDFSADTEATNKYAGLFGVTDGAIIKNVGVTGTTKVKIGSCINAYIGNVIGKASASTLQYDQTDAKVEFQDDIFAHNVYFGEFAGMLSDSNLSHFIAKTTDVGTWTLTNQGNRTYNIGGAVGALANSRMTFGAISNNFRMTIDSIFRGKLNIGGIVGNISQNGSKIINFVVENNFDMVDNNTAAGIDNIDMGQIVGTISNPAPQSGNLTYIYFKTNFVGELFGEFGNYSYQNTGTKDNNVSVNSSFNSETSFTSRQWHTLSGNWDFEKIWFISANAIALQSFYGDFTISLGSGLQSGNILECVEGLATDTSGNPVYTKGYRYGASASFTFKFRKIVDGTRNIEMKDYYSLAALTLAGREVATIANVDGTYVLTDSTNFELTKSGDNYTLTIKSVNRSTAAVVDIKTSPKTFKLEITSRLYSDDELTEEVPSYVYLTGGTEKETLTIDNVQFGTTLSVDTIQKNAKSPYSFAGWFMVNEEGGNDSIINTDITMRVLSINFGRGLFVGDSKIYAKYNDDACIVTFKMDEGIKEIDLYSGSSQITKTNTSIAVSKKEATFKIEVYVNEGYSFDVEDFIATLDTYKSSDTTKTFCTWNNRDEADENTKYFVFTLDMTTLTGDFAEEFNINVSTTQLKQNNNAMIWYIVGGVGGAVVLTGIIILIVVLKKRNGGFGGGMGGGSFSKKSYKDMYF